MNGKTWIFSSVLIAFSLMLMACAQPGAQTASKAPQSGVQGSIQSSGDWQALAQKVSGEISEMIQGLNEQFPDGFHIQQVYIETRDDSAFSKALESFMVTDLTHLGVIVKDEPADAYQVAWSVQNVAHDEKMAPRRGALGKEEVIINVTIYDREHILYRQSKIYDINPLDRDNYHFTKDLYHADKQVKTRTVEVRGVDEPKPLPTVELTETVHFEFDEYEILDEYAAVLDRFADLLRQRPGVPVVVEGHTDSIGTEEYNQELSKRRALAVRDYLVEQNIQTDRLKTEGYSFLRPVAPNVTEDGQDNPEGRALNRRVELHLLDSNHYAYNN